jgi:hypothetical protein
MEETVISTALDTTNSSMVTFKNPLREAMNVLVSINDDSEQSQFNLLLKRNKFTVGANSLLQIPFSFNPYEISESRAELIVAMNQSMKWR